MIVSLVFETLFCQVELKRTERKMIRMVQNFCPDRVAHFNRTDIGQAAAAHVTKKIGKIGNFKIIPAMTARQWPWTGKNDCHTSKNYFLRYDFSQYFHV
jgi:hypothetical protein